MERAFDKLFGTLNLHNGHCENMRNIEIFLIIMLFMLAMMTRAFYVVVYSPKPAVAVILSMLIIFLCAFMYIGTRLRYSVCVSVKQSPNESFINPFII